RIVSAVIWYYLIRIVKVPALIFIGFWFILQFLYVLIGSLGGVAYWAHIGGFFAGFMVALATNQIIRSFGR
ncbi:MAG: rhomboid family intramembrane serine protease, partial [archaeon]|nr:rhomboid family intramembrane serine protease [archaeon]